MVYIGKIPLAAFHALLELLAIFHHTALDHLSKEVVTFTCTLTDTGEHRETVVTLGDIIDKLHDKHGLTYTGTTEKTDFTTLAVRLEKVDHLNACGKDFGTRREVLELRRWLVDRAQVLAFERRQFVDSLAHHIEQTAFDLVAGRNGNRTFEIDHRHTAAQAVGTLHGHAAHGIFADMLLHFEDGFTAFGTVDLKSGIDGRYDVAFEAHIHHRTYHLGYFACIVAHSLYGGVLFKSESL